ncbi:rhomboid-related protein 2-like [Lycorma delicatula]|uniref:rhomboid-related protein 2-like n=1 Tax=Lycorma delicatula TaxID=130591 RepID=UPI003F5151DF
MSQQSIKGGPNHATSIPLRSVEHHWLTIFKKYDADNDGKISVRELYNQVNGPNFTNDIPKHAVQNIVKQFDVNSDGFIDFDEFVILMESDIGRRLINRTLNRYIKHTVVPRKRKIQTHRDITDGEYEDEYTCSPPPICMLLVSTIEIAFFLYDLYSLLFSSKSKYAGFTDGPFRFGPVAELTLYTPSKRSEIWRFFTYMFVHANFFHLFVNVTVQLLLGIPLEMVHHWWRVLIIYLAGVLAGSLGTSVFDPTTSLVGASGGVYAIITAHLSTIILNWSEMEHAGWQLTIFLILMVVDFGQFIYYRYFLQVDLRIGYEAHLAGAVAGLLVGVYVLRNLEVHSWEKVLKWICFALYIVLTALAVFYNIFYL